MKKYKFSHKIIVLFLMIFASILTANSSAKIVKKTVCDSNSSSEQYYWARINSDCTFYSTPKASEKYALCTLPSSYFVKITAINGDFYQCYYGQNYGFVSTSAVSVIDGTPQNPTAECEVTIFALDGLDLYSSPSSGEMLLRIDYYAEDVNFIGYATGDELVPTKGNDWLYVSFGTMTGYLYSTFCFEVNIAENDETFDLYEGELFASISASSSSLSSSAKILIVLAVTIPSIIIIYLLIKPSLILKKPSSQPKRVPVLRRKDYFEFDEHDL